MKGLIGDSLGRAFITSRVVVQVLLVVLLRIPPPTSRQDLGDNAAVPPLRICALGDILGDRLLLGIVVEDPAPVLRTPIATLSVEGGGVVHAVEVFEESLVGDLLGVEDDLASFGVCIWQSMVSKTCRGR